MPKINAILNLCRQNYTILVKWQGNVYNSSIPHLVIFLMRQIILVLLQLFTKHRCATKLNRFPQTVKTKIKTFNYHVAEKASYTNMMNIYLKITELKIIVNIYVHNNLLQITPPPEIFMFIDTSFQQNLGKANQSEQLRNLLKSYSSVSTSVIFIRML